MKLPQVRVLLSETHNPWFNLATEEWIFSAMDPQVQTLFLWRNSPTVVIGRNQNPWSECNLSKMEEDGVFLARRSSGGGAVFHDLGNSCFTFLSPRESYSRLTNTEIVIRALGRFGISSFASGRNDLIIESDDGPRKISGAAFRETRDRSFHHGTVLLSADLSRLADYLTPHPKKLQSKGRASVRARVMNLCELNAQLNHQLLSRALIEEFFAQYGARCEVEVLDPQKLEGHAGLRQSYERLSSWEWRFGHAPKFKQQVAKYLSWGFVDIHFDADHGKIERAKIFSDALQPEWLESLEAELPGEPFSQSGIERAVNRTLLAFPGAGAELGELKEWLFDEVETTESV